MFPRGGGGAGPQPRWKSSKQQQQQQHLCFREQVSPAPASSTYPPLSRASEARPEHWKSSPATQLPPERDAGHPGTTLPLVPVSPTRGGKGEGRQTEEVEVREGLFLMLNHPALMVGDRSSGGGDDTWLPLPLSLPPVLAPPPPVPEARASSREPTPSPTTHSRAIPPPTAPPPRSQEPEMPTAHVQCTALLNPPPGGRRPSGRPRRQELCLEGRFNNPPPPLHQSRSENYPAVMTKREEGNAYFFLKNRCFSQHCHPTPRSGSSGGAGAGDVPRKGPGGGEGWTADPL